MTIRDEEKRKKRAAETSQNAIIKNPSGGTASTGATTTSSNIYSGIPTTTEADTVSYGDPVEQANAMLQHHINDKPGAFVFGNQGLLDQAYTDYLNREGFTYDMSRDPFYQQYRDQYSALGKLAMEDTMGMAASLTGGYGNSYAQTVGQQAYNNYMMQLNNMLPELYSMSRGNYDAEGQQMLNNIALLEGQKQSDYTQYQNEMNDWYNWLGYLQNDAQYKGQQALAGSGDGSYRTGDDTIDVDNPGGSGLTYDDIVAEANNFIKNGSSKSEIGAYLRERYTEGDITLEEYRKLQAQFVPRGNTY